MFLTRMAEVRSPSAGSPTLPRSRFCLAPARSQTRWWPPSYPARQHRPRTLQREFGERWRRIHGAPSALRLDAVALGQLFDIAQVSVSPSVCPAAAGSVCAPRDIDRRDEPAAELKALASQLGLHLCCDCISSIGALPVDLRGSTSAPPPAARAWQLPRAFDGFSRLSAATGG